MSQPIGYYTSYTPGDRGLLEDLQTRWGATFEKLTRKQKLYLIVGIASNLCCHCQDTTLDAEIAAISVQVHQQLATNDQEGLLEALIAQIRYQ
ncbi:hypothetical protein H6G04_30065 [Calothrix membranacea FACHB-236]|nr:hypothetical protein [Calothrix membranacea FACHB-236]